MWSNLVGFSVEESVPPIQQRVVVKCWLSCYIKRRANYRRNAQLIVELDFLLEPQEESHCVQVYHHNGHIWLVACFCYNSPN